jgi:hypothetical protein
MLIEHLPSLEYPPIFCMHPCSACTPPIPLYSLAVQPRPNYPLLFCREQAGSAGSLLLAGQFGAARFDPSRSVIPISVWRSRTASGPGFDWHVQLVCCDLVGRIFWCSDRGLLLGRFGIGAQLGIGERGICY